MPGVETALPLMLTQAMQGRCTVAQVVNWMSTAVAKAYNIPNKGLIQVGYDADLILVDLTNYHPVLRSEAVRCNAECDLAQSLPILCNDSRKPERSLRQYSLFWFPGPSYLGTLWRLRSWFGFELAGWPFAAWPRLLECY